ncbi:hypothetical protein QCN29_30145 [Streptomyces sp. HNM0663]|uniref:Uncharacterized protein n=1 Tax=Streptomyces chengmaiensis TaxID=3040919 RepID=A0ABT6HW79_9ACTN|nr:hypothetical protein [Streptomyces chengmaiensis]MDH2392966.1 hypothetical protein [Streptomyces chengmaiensis]
MYGLQELGALVATLPREHVAEAARKQMRRLAVETGLAKYTEVSSTLDALDRGETVRRGQASPLGLRLRTIMAQADQHMDDLRRWAAENMVHAVWGTPHQAVCDIAATRSNLSLHWLAELHADLGHPPIPPIPDDHFWATPRNPDIDTSWYADRYAQDQN